MLASRVSVALPLLRARALRPRTSRALSVSAMAAPTPKLKLTYFNIKARAEPTRLALHIGGVPFEDVRIEHSAWPAMKASMPLGQIPVLEIDGVQLAQSYAMLMYAGRLAKLVPQDLLQAAQVEEVLFHLIDLDTLLAPSGKEADASKKAQLRESLAAGPLLSWFAGLERFAGRNASGWLVGDSLTVADLALYSRVMSFKLGKYDNIPGNIVDGFPKVSALYERVLKHPKVAEWNAMPGH